MISKLTLSVRKETIEKAKEYAKRHNKSISKMIESYLETLAGSDAPSDPQEISPFVKSLSLTMDIKDEAQSEYWEQLIGKHSK